MINFYNILTSSFFSGLRKFLRKIGLNKYIFKILFQNNNPDYYEDHFKNVMVSKLKESDCVWDIGANLGLYSIEFSKIIGDQGKVYAFEPSYKNFDNLKKNIKYFAKIQPVMIALSDKEEQITMLQGSDNLGATTKVVDKINNINKESFFTTSASTGDLLIENNKCSRPNFLKIDTEGYEYEVLKGLRNELKENTLRTICLEVHFTILEQRNKSKNVRDIKQLLIENNYKIEWVDFSHLIATKKIDGN